MFRKSGVLLGAAFMLAGCGSLSSLSLQPAAYQEPAEQWQFVLNDKNGEVYGKLTLNNPDGSWLTAYGAYANGAFVMGFEMPREAGVHRYATVLLDNIPVETLPLICQETCKAGWVPGAKLAPRLWASTLLSVSYVAAGHEVVMPLTVKNMKRVAASLTQARG